VKHMCLLCSRHHTEVHLGIWELIMIDGVPWARPPDWIDPRRRLVRNTYGAASDEARRLGTQLRLDPPPDAREAAA
jgi:hypothetical protein